MAKKARSGGTKNGNIVLGMEAHFGSLTKQLDEVANRLDKIIERNIKILDQFDKMGKSSGGKNTKDKTINKEELRKEGRYLAERAFYIKQGREEWQKENGLIEEEQKTLKKQLASRVAIMAVIRKTTQLMVKSVKISADWAENLNLFAVTFGEGYEEAVDWAVDFANKLGYSQVAIVKYTGLFKQLSDAIGVTAENGKQISQVLTQLGADISSFYNISLESAMEKLQAGIFSGQTKPLRSVGIDVTYQSIDNLLQTNAELSKLNVTSKQLTQDQKVLARTILVTTAAMNSWGDSAKTINSLANQIKVFQGSLQNLGLAIGDMVAPAITQLITILNGFIMALTTFIRMFVGMVKTVPYEIKDMAETVADEYSEIEEAAGGLLSFDKFEVLGGGEQEKQNATLALTAELQKTIAEYQARQNEELTNIQNNAIKVRDAIMGFLGYEWDETTQDFVKVNYTLEGILTVVGLLTASKIWGLLLKLPKLLASIMAFLTPTKLVIAAIAVGLYAVLQNFEKMSVLEKIAASVGLLTAAFLSLNMALGIFKAISTPTAIFGIIAGVGLMSAAIASANMKAYADGGTPDRGEIFSMNEYGRPEAFVKSGGHTSVINDITMGSLVKQGVIEAIRETGIIQTIRDSGANVTVEGDAQQMFKVIEREGRRRYGKGWGR